MLWQFDLDTLLFCPNGRWLSTARAIFSNGRGPVKPVILRRTFQQTSTMMIRSTLRETMEVKQYMIPFLNSKWGTLP